MVVMVGREERAAQAVTVEMGLMAASVATALCVRVPMSAPAETVVPAETEAQFPQYFLRTTSILSLRTKAGAPAKAVTRVKKAPPEIQGQVAPGELELRRHAQRLPMDNLGLREARPLPQRRVTLGRMAHNLASLVFLRMFNIEPLPIVQRSTPL
jgi:hypothetical protein